MTTLIGWGLIIVVFFVLFRRNKTRSLSAYKAYYTKKRREYPWLENWIKENIDPAPIRAKESTSSGNLWSVIIFLVVVVIGSFIARQNIPLQIISLVAAFVAGELAGRKFFAGKPEKLLREREGGLFLECPYCHCPHSWVMTEIDNTVEGKTAEGVKTTTTVKGGGTDWGFGAGDKVSSETKITSVYWYGKSVQDFKCLNCGKTEQMTFSRHWPVEPNKGHKVLEPPMQSWEIPPGVAKK
ncbi:MAG: hypothetical protein FWB86_13825 [Treponema sp.]|nr:hypothetical protein [Treponema sp.]